MFHRLMRIKRKYVAAKSASAILRQPGTVWMPHVGKK